MEKKGLTTAAGAPVVDNNNFQVMGNTLGPLQNLSHGGRQPVGFIIGGNNNGQFHQIKMPYTDS